MINAQHSWLIFTDMWPASQILISLSCTNLCNFFCRYYKKLNSIASMDVNEYKWVL